MTKLAKFFSIIFLLYSFLFLFQDNILADNFKTFLTAIYEIDDSAKAQVDFQYTIENLKSEELAKEFHVNFTHLKPENIKVTEGNKDLTFDVTQEQNSIYLKIIFPDDLYGVGKKRTFNIKFWESNISKKTGNIVEVSIPKINSSDLDNFESILIVPSSVGEAAYITPKNFDKQSTDKNTKYIFRGKTPLESGINAAFGEFQVFDYILNYNLENESSKNSIADVAFPPDTQYQKVYITNIEPLPVKAGLDEDGNWIYSFKLTPFEKKTIKVEGSVQLFSNPRLLTMPTPQTIIKNLNESQYWQVTADPIKKIANELKTPDAIYDYVVKNLKYDFTRVNPQSQRMGALLALQNSSSSLCTEFTDLFIAIARAAGIPAREVQGYAYTQNDKLLPLSLVSDVLHAWPQYWDNDKRAWISVDPTWESTTGVDYFNKFDLNHFAFVIHGTKDDMPLPAGSYKFSTAPKKDVYVNYGHVPKTNQTTIEFSHKVLDKFNPFQRTLLLTLINTDNKADYNSFLKISSDDNKISDDSYIDTLIPQQQYHKEIKLYYGLLARNAPENIKVYYNDAEYNFDTGRDIVLIIQISLFLVIIFAITASYAIYHKRSHRRV